MADIHDALPQAVRSTGLLDPSMRAITPGLSACGQSVTAFCEPGDSLMSHCAAYLARPGDVLVISNGGTARGALWGGHLAFDAKVVGLAGTIVDAPIRDTHSIRRLQYPLWATGVSVSRSEKNGYGYVNMPVTCGGKIINPGDIIVADDDGVLAFPPSYIASIVATVRAKARDDADIRRRVEKGERLFDTQGFGQLLAMKGIQILDRVWKAEEL